jgi:AraC-like DNA-binding protein/mannose-6-phosphate isomerase-like protein (cupin superfamily)
MAQILTWERKAENGGPCQLLFKIAHFAMALEFMGGGEVVPDPAWRMQAHQHLFYELIVILEGRMQLRADGAEVVGEAGDLLLYRPGLVHAESSDPAAPVSTLFFCFRASPTLLRGVPLRVQDRDGRLRLMTAWALQDHKSGRPLRQQDQLLAAMLAELRRLAASPPDPLLTVARHYMERRLTDRLHLGDIARQVQMSRFAFVRKFKRLSGQTPMQALRTMRLNRARVLLLTSSLPLKAIAPAAGLGDEYQLSKLFRRYFHQSPREMRIRRPTGKTRAGRTAALTSKVEG